MIQVAGFTSKFIEVFIGILAGCKHSIDMTRAHTGEDFDKVDKSHPRANLKVHVDDLSFLCYRR